MHPGIGDERTVVAVVLQWRKKIALLKRSREVRHDAGRWHCITGFVEKGVTPLEQARRELLEETGLAGRNVLTIRTGPILSLSDDSGAPWTVHTFIVVTPQRRLILDWEHDSYKWTTPARAARFTNRVPWLDPVLRAAGYLHPRSTPASLCD